MADEDGPETPRFVGAGIAIGVGVGTALFAATDNAAWIGIGIALGIAIGAGLDRRSG